MNHWLYHDFTYLEIHDISLLASRRPASFVLAFEFSILLSNAPSDPLRIHVRSTDTDTRLDTTNRSQEYMLVNALLTRVR